jgi:Ran GTPase-activating protein (RanGAP) involved in mRNA processing and transport
MFSKRPNSNKGDPDGKRLKRETPETKDGLLSDDEEFPGTEDSQADAEESVDASVDLEVLPPQQIHEPIPIPQPIQLLPHQLPQLPQNPMAMAMAMGIHQKLLIEIFRFSLQSHLSFQESKLPAMALRKIQLTQELSDLAQLPPEIQISRARRIALELFIVDQEIISVYRSQYRAPKPQKLSRNKEIKIPGIDKNTISIDLSKLPHHKFKIDIWNLRRILAQCEQVSTLKSLNFSGHNLGTWTRKLEDREEVLKIHLAFSKFLKKHAATLTQLFLSKCKLDDPSIAILLGGLQTQHLMRLEMQHNGMGNKYDVWQNPFDGDEGTKALAQFVDNNPSLIWLDVAFNGIDNTGNGLQALLWAISKHQALTYLNLGSNDIGAYSTADLGQMLGANTVLTSLNLSHNKLAALKALEYLGEGLKKNRSLRELDLSSNYMKDAGANQLALSLQENTTLTSLRLKMTHIQSDEVTASLLGNFSLTLLDLSNNKIGIKENAAAALALSTLQWLILQDTQIYDNDVIRIANALEVNQALTYLDLSTNKIGDEGVKALTALLEKNLILLTLLLAQNNVGDHGATLISICLSANTTLTALDLQENPIGVKGATSLAQAVSPAINTSLRRLCFFKKDPDEATSAIFTTLQVDHSLATVSNDNIIKNNSPAQQRMIGNRHLYQNRDGVSLARLCQKVIEVETGGDQLRHLGRSGLSH